MSTLPPGFAPAPDEPPLRPRPAPSPVGPAVVNHYHAPLPPPGNRGLYAVIAALALTAGALGAHALGLRLPQPPVESEGVKVGRQLAPAVAASLAKGFEAGADELAAGKTVGEADAKLKNVFETERQKAFAAIGGPYLSQIVPSGEEPSGDAKRKAFAEAHRAIAQGLRGAR